MTLETQRQDDDKDTGATKPRRSTRTKPKAKLPTLDDIENAKSPSDIVDGSDNSPDEGVFDQTGERTVVHLTGASPKRKATSSNGHVNAKPLAGIQNQANIEHDQGASDQTALGVGRIGDQIWEILDGDQRTQLEVGVEAPNRLKLRFRNRTTDQIRMYVYKKGDVNFIRNIDWNDKKQLESITKWRAQIFNRMKFPIREMVRWSKNEVAFLTLVYEKFVLALEQTKRISLPNRDTVFQLFTDEFGDVRDGKIFDIRIRRKDDSRLAKLRNRIEGEIGDLKPQGGPLYLLTIDPGEVEAYLKHSYVALKFDQAEYQRFWKARPVIEMAAQARKTAQRKQESHKKATSNKTKTGKVIKSQKARKSRQTAKTMKAAPGSPDDGTSTTSGHDAAQFGHIILEDSDIRRDLLETTVAVETYTAKTARDKWLFTVMGPSAVSETLTHSTQSSRLEQELGAQIDQRQKSPQARDWMLQAQHDLHQRLQRDVDLVNEQNRNGLRAAWYVDYDENTEGRLEGAPAVNALLSSAIVPPVGYHGDIRALVKDKALPEDELRLHALSESALRQFHEAHDKEYEEMFGTPTTAGE